MLLATGTMVFGSTENISTEVIAIWFRRKNFVYYHHSTPTRNRQKKVHKMKT